METPWPREGETRLAKENILEFLSPIVSAFLFKVDIFHSAPAPANGDSFLA